MPRRDQESAGFSLVELLVVLTIIAILAALTVPAVSGILKSSNLTTGSQTLASQLNVAQQYAMAKNCVVEFRFYQLPNPTTTSTSPTLYRAFQSLAVSADGVTFTPITKVVYLPTQICIVDGTNGVHPTAYSSLLNPGTSGSPPFYILGTAAGTSLGSYPPSSYNYFDFHFEPDGSTDLNPSGTAWFVSLASLPIQSAAGLPAVNFVTLQVNATTGRVASFRPN